MSSLPLEKLLLQEVPARIALHYSVIPVATENGTLGLIAPEDMSRSVREELRIVLGKAVEFAFVPRAEAEAAVARHYGIGAEVIESLTQDKNHESVEVLDFEIIDQDKKVDASITKLVNELMLDGLKRRASDIHIEPFEHSFRIRYRVDGLLQEAGVSEKIRQLAPSLISRVKIMAKLDIGEKRLPQDGRIKIKRHNDEIDLRVSVLPSSFGEAIVIRILRPLALLNLTELGLGDEHLKQLRQLITKPQGLILVTGPTGSGKTTSLYACLKELNQIERKILTIEDPIEYKLPGIIQMQVHTKIGFDFSHALRAMLRHDPDCIMVGEIRDSETAKIAVASALTGHLVFSTLHTNDAPSAVTRLFEMGIEPYLVASSVEAVIAQRLVRRCCAKCLITPVSNCETCSGSGFFGRLAIYETMRISESLRTMISGKETASKIRGQALAEGMIPLYEDGIKKSVQGLTTVEEVRRIVAC